MCKCCKSLKQLKDLDEKSYRKIIRLWKRRDAKARSIIMMLVSLLKETYISYDSVSISDMRKEYHCQEAIKFCLSNLLGK